MKLTVLGSGTCIPEPENTTSSYLIEHDNRYLLIDCGSGTLRQLVKGGYDYKAIDAVFLTHLHPDHISDLMALLHALVATPGFKRKAPLYIFGPERLQWFYSDVVLRVLRKPDSFEVILNLCPCKESLFEFDITSSKTVHSADSLAYRFDTSRGTIVFTGDADYSDELVELSMGADILVADCSFPDEMKRPGHMTPSECGRLADKAGAKRLVLSHLYPVVDTPEIWINQCSSYYNGQIVLAKEFVSLSL